MVYQSNGGGSEGGNGTAHGCSHRMLSHQSGGGRQEQCKMAE